MVESRRELKQLSKSEGMAVLVRKHMMEVSWIQREWIAAGARRIPRTNPLVDMGLDWIRQDPAPSEAILEGLFLGSSAPHHQFRIKMEQPTLVIGHHADPLHPFSDAGMLAEELPDARLIEANSILEWRLSPKRLDGELSRFLDDVWEREPSSDSPDARAAAARA